MDLYKHQVTGVDWLAQRSRALLADEAGLGKSITSLVAAEHAGAEHVLILAPTIVAFNWQRELQRWAPQREVGMLTATEELAAAGCPTCVCTHGLTISRPVFNKLRERDWDLVIIDEAHVFRNESAQRTRALYGTGGIISRAKRVWALTGTPMPNHAAELWPMLRGVWPDRCPYSFEQFRDRFCETRWDHLRKEWKVVGNKNVDELKALLSGLFLRRLKKDHLDLPPVRWETVVMPTPVRLPELVQFERSLRTATFDPAQASGDELLAVLRQNADFSRWRHACGLAKVAPTLELLALEDTTQKTVIFAHHLDVLEGLERGLGADNCVAITGSVGARERQQRVDLFQTDPAIRYAVCQIQAAGTGITLTAADEVVFVESSFVPAEVAQAADRVHRIGQKNQVRARFLALAGTVDSLVAETLARKAAGIAEVLGEN